MESRNRAGSEDTAGAVGMRVTRVPIARTPDRQRQHHASLREEQLARSRDGVVGDGSDEYGQEGQRQEGGLDGHEACELAEAGVRVDQEVGEGYSPAR